MQFLIIYTWKKNNVGGTRKKTLFLNFSFIGKAPSQKESSYQKPKVKANLGCLRLHKMNCSLEQGVFAFVWTN